MSKKFFRRKIPRVFARENVRKKETVAPGDSLFVKLNYKKKVDV
mgnify:CR=1 FL=1